MSSTVQCASNADIGFDGAMSLEIGALVGYAQAPRVYLRIRDAGKERGLVNPTRADLIAAVETECGVRIVAADAIVIERAELPEVTTRGGSVSVKVFTWSDSSADDLREVAACYLAAAEYMAAHPSVPPVSDEDVETLAGLMDDVDAAVMSATSLARRLLATGRVSVTK